MSILTNHYARNVLAALFLLLIINGMPVPAHAILGINIRNVSIGGGFNTAWKAADYPEVPHYSEPDLKKSFVIDLRLDIPLRERLRFVPDFSYWSWGRFPKQGTEGPNSQLQCFDINFDLQMLLARRGQWQPYVGCGLGIHIFRHISRFPYEMFERLPIAVSEIIESSLKVGPNISIGNDFYILPGMALFQEIRWEFVPGFQQVRFLIGLNTF